MVEGVNPVRSEANFTSSSPPECILVCTTRRKYFIVKNWLAERELANGMKIDERWECSTLCTIETKVRTQRAEGRHL